MHHTMSLGCITYIYKYWQRGSIEILHTCIPQQIKRTINAELLFV